MIGGLNGYVVSLLPEGYLLRVNAHLLHLVDQLIWHLISKSDVDLLALAFTKDALCIFELSDCFGLCVVARCYSDDVQERIEHGLPEAPMRLAIVDKHLLDHLGRGSAAEATRLCPGLVDHAIASHSVHRQRSIYIIQVSVGKIEGTWP